MIFDRKESPDINGWVVYKDNPISKEGVFLYSGKAIGLPDLDPGELYPVYRPGSELEKAAESFKLVPWIAGHTHLGADGEDAGNVQISGIVGEDVYFRDGVLYGNLKVFAKDHAALIEGGIKELSLGYRADFERASGEFNGEPYQFIQRNLQGNHLASVEEGRCGHDVRVQDSFIFDAKELETMDEETKARIEALEEQNRQMLEALQALREAVGATKPADNADPEKKPADEDPEGGEQQPAVEVKKETEEVAVITVEAVTADAMPKVIAALGRRDKLAQSLQKHVGVFDHSEMTERQVAEYGAKKLGVTAGELAGYLRGLEAAAKSHVPAQIGDADEGQAAGNVPAFLANHV